MRSASEQSGAELVLASFFWLVKDGMVLDPVRHRAILEYSARATRRSAIATSSGWRLREPHIRQAPRAHKLDFIDVAHLMPFDPDLYIDAIHNSYAGERLRAWVFLQALVPIVESHLKSGAWPRKPCPPKTRRRRSRRERSPSTASDPRHAPQLPWRSVASPLRMCMSRITSRPSWMLKPERGAAGGRTAIAVAALPQRRRGGELRIVGEVRPSTCPCSPWAGAWRDRTASSRCRSR